MLSNRTNDDGVEAGWIEQTNWKPELKLNNICEIYKSTALYKPFELDKQLIQSQLDEPDKPFLLGQR